jgi:hypothetical protein
MACPYTQAVNNAPADDPTGPFVKGDTAAHTRAAAWAFSGLFETLSGEPHGVNQLGRDPKKIATMRSNRRKVRGAEELRTALDFLRKGGRAHGHAD